LSERKTDKLTILVVEDDMIVRFTIAEFLRGSDCKVVEASTAEAAVAVLQQRNGIDAVFTDIQLGGALSGWDVAEVSRATHPAIPVVYTSGNAVAPGRSVPGSVFLEKPYDPAAVLSACKTLFDSR
jgi:CheY-like chemotaxis protein